MTTNQAIKLQQLFLQVSEIFGEIAGQEVAEVKAPTNVVDLPVQTETVEVEQQEVVETEPETPSLESLSIAELRKMAKELGLDTKGKKVDIIARIEALNEPVEENVEEVVEEVIETPEVEEVEVDDVEDEVLIEDEDDAEEEYEEEEADEDDEEPSELELLKAELEDYSLEELKEVLESVELSTKGKKQALISRIIQAVEDGIIAYGDEEEEIEVEDDLDELVTDEDEIEVEEVTDEEESDDEEDYEDEEEEEEEEELTVREQAQAEIEERILEDYENGDLTDKQITKFLNEYSNGTFKTVNKKRSLNKYIEIMTELVDEDGDVVELGEPYYVGDDVAFCCGAELKEVDGDFYCEICGNEYEGE